MKADYKQDIEAVLWMLCGAAMSVIGVWFVATFMTWIVPFNDKEPLTLFEIIGKQWDHVKQLRVF